MMTKIVSCYLNMFTVYSVFLYGYLRTGGASWAQVGQLSAGAGLEPHSALPLQGRICEQKPPFFIGHGTSNHI